MPELSRQLMGVPILFYQFIQGEFYLPALVARKQPSTIATLEPSGQTTRRKARTARTTN